MQTIKKQVNKKGLTAATGLELNALPPTSYSVKYHTYRAYYQVQKWLSNDIISRAGSRKKYLGGCKKSRGGASFMKLKIN